MAKLRNIWKMNTASVILLHLLAFVWSEPEPDTHIHLHLPGPDKGTDTGTGTGPDSGKGNFQVKRCPIIFPPPRSVMF